MTLFKFPSLASLFCTLLKKCIVIIIYPNIFNKTKIQTRVTKFFVAFDVFYESVILKIMLRTALNVN